MNPARYHFVFLLAVALCIAATAPRAAAQDENYREREVFDPNADSWIPDRPAAPDTPAGTLDEARRLLVEKKPRDARKLLKDWLEESYDDERYYEGVFLLGEAYFEMRDFWKAAERFEEVAENASGELFVRANERVVDTARAFLSGQKRIVWKIFRVSAYDEAIEFLDRVWERMPGTPLGEYALKLKADFYFNRGEVDLAEDEYAFLVQQYPNGRYIQIAMLRSAEAAEASFPGVRYDDRPLLEANLRYQQVERTFPVFADREQVPQRLEGIRQKRAEKLLYVGRWYERTRQPAAAEFYYRALLREWPDTLAAADARTRLRALGVTIDEETGREDNRP